MPEEEEDEADEEEPPVILVDELKPSPLNCSNIKMYYCFVIIETTKNCLYINYIDINT